jgi:2,3-bisphosphoglycerate-dependent phosphoglycerate mutase
LDQRLRERHFGIFEGKLRAHFTTEEKRIYQTYRRDPFHEQLPEGERWEELSVRLDDWLKSLPSQGKYLAVTHGGLIRAALTLLVGCPKSYEWNVRIANTSISRFQFSSEQKILITLMMQHTSRI